MTFVFSPWYFVMIALVIGIVVCLTIFFKMDKKDSKIIEKFLAESQSQAEETQESESQQKEISEVEEKTTE